MNKPKLYYDDTCPVCTVFADNVAPHVDTIPVNDAPQSLDTTALLTTIHYVDSTGTLRTGADAVTTALSLRYSVLRCILPLIRSPRLAPLVTWGYRAFSTRRHLFSQRLFWLQAITITGFLAGILCSLPLWFSVERTYPPVPLLDALTPLFSLTPWLSGILVVSLAAALIYHTNRRLLITLSLVTGILLILLDVSRAQPWILHYLGILFLVLFITKSSERIASIIAATQLLIASIYFWSGLQKMNAAFYLDVFPWMTEPLWSSFGLPGATAAFSVGIMVPLIECAFAVGLLTRRFRLVSIYGSVIMLIVVLSMLMVGHSWNTVVWPWNVTIFLSVLVLFLGNTQTISTTLFDVGGKVLLGVVILLYSITPIGNWFGITPHYAAWSLYSGKVPTATLAAPREILTSLVPGHTEDTLSFTTWSFSSLGVPAYPEPFVFFRVFDVLCTFHPNDLLTLTISTPELLWSHRRADTTLTCQPTGY